jgi:tRNA uridine 5-carbamoylmethylation protein Kti12
MLVINLWGGPGAGKSTIAAELFVCLRKHTNANVELTNEFATELCFERNKETSRIRYTSWETNGTGSGGLNKSESMWLSAIPR